MTKQDLYVSVENPGIARKGVLEASKQLIGMLRSYERLRVIRAEKKEALAKLKNSIAELGAGITELKQALPEVKLNELPRLPQQPKQKAALPAAKAQKNAKEELPRAPKQPIQRKTQVEKLEEELGRIEDRLKGL